MLNRAAGAMPESGPTSAPLTMPSTGSPAAVDAVCEPWPSKSRGEENSPGLAADRPAESYQRAPITLLLHVTGFSPVVSQVPWNLAAMVAASGRGVGNAAKLGFSGQKP